MAVEISQGSPIATALQNVVQPKLAEMGWSTGGLDDSALCEYIILMLVNGKTQEQIASELSEDLLGLGPEDVGAAADFSKWLFTQVETLNAQVNGNPHNGQTSNESTQDATISTSNSGADSEMNDAGANGPGSIPTGPKAMRNGTTNPREKRMLGNINKALDRSGDATLHRVRGGAGAGRINSHSREPPKGPRSKLNRNLQQMANSGLPNMQMQQAMGGMMGPGSAQMTPDQQMEMMTFWQQGAQMMQQLFQQGIPNGGPVFNPAFQRNNQQTNGKSLFDRVQKPRHGSKPGNHNKTEASQSDAEMGGVSGATGSGAASGMDFELTPASKPAGETRCRFDVSCTNAECAFVHQSPAARPGTTIDMAVECGFGAACKNFKCVGKHPSPAKKNSYQSEQDCDWGPLCKNHSCQFRHSTMPGCRNGGDCTLEGCKFAHTRIACVHNPCTRPGCAFKHADGQKRGNFDDKVWTSNSGEQNGHVSERKFVTDDGEEELIIPGGSNTPAAGEGIIT